MPHSKLDLFENVFDKLEKNDASSQNMGEWEETLLPPRQGKEKTTNVTSST
tara:strand:- start:745 stop:897 length:153 start_codon:yes stop_codon:yes gene_type:complete